MVHINGINIGSGTPPFIIAEMSGNHDQSLDKALAIVDAVANSGAHAIKLQTYTADTMTIDISEAEFFITDNLWKGHSLYQLYQMAHTPWEWHEPIFKHARSRGLIAFSTPFDATAVDFLEQLDVPAYKISSFETIDLPLIRKVAATGKPLIISTGMANLTEIDEAVRTARENGCTQLVLLKCTSNYPASPASSNLATIPYLKTIFDCEVGLSDHTLGIGAAVASVALGGRVIEKHVTLNRADGGVDSAFSLEPAELSQLVMETHNAWQALGQVSIGPSAEEKSSLNFRRSLYICDNLTQGEVLTSTNLRAIRPGLGLAPKYINQFLGKKVSRSVKKGTPLSWDLIE